ncbi:MAG: aminotransferase class I/II-fold pyridoxal phosphate-dependent enzyme [Anaerolineae bacterium]|nr:aminotransferase class I/II-fold pyridoxal phosphate-dependent enzyme [Anaerolineae bacterium]
MNNPLQSRQTKTLVDLLQQRAAEHPHQRAYTFLRDGETDAVALTYGELDQRARAIAAWLQQQKVTGQPVLLLYPPGLDFIAALFGCFYAGAMAVPAYPPQLNRNSARLSAIMNNAQAKLFLTNTATIPQLERWAGQIPLLKTMDRLNTDNRSPELADTWSAPELKPDTLAFLQYTSGSTALPKGVMVTHANIINNLKLVIQTAGFEPESHHEGVSWLPPYHDLGLIGFIFLGVYTGRPFTLMSPVAFLQKPLRWLQAISRTRATYSAGPNFAYDLCVEKITPAQRAALDLSSWEIAIVGADPIRHKTLARFAATFGPCGFRKQAFYPSYGMAEATLVISGGLQAALPVTCTVQTEALKNNQIIVTHAEAPGNQTLVGCGRPLAEQKVIIVDPHTLTPCPPDKVGEIWVSGPGVTQGYWHQPEETTHTFRAYLSNREGPFLRTGDLGFLQDGELFIAGRLKDLIIIRGQNYHPQDLELTAAASHPALQPTGGAAFSVDAGDEEKLVITFELKRRQRQADPVEVAGAIRRAIAAEYGLHVETVVLLKPGGLPKTASGKTQRYLCREKFLAGTLTILSVDTLSQPPASASMAKNGFVTAGEQNQTSLAQALRTEIAQTLGLSPEMIDPHQPMSALGIDSLKAITLQTLLETKYGVTLSLETFLELAELSIAQIAAHLEAGTLPVQITSPPEMAPLNTGTEINRQATKQPVGSVFDKARAFDLMDQARRANLMPYFRELTQNEGPTCTFEGRRVLMFGSNNYLGLTVDERVRQAAANAALTEGPSLTGSRLLNGSTPQHRLFEQKLAEFLGREDALIFTTGYQANIGLLSALMTSDTTLLVDERCHASIYDGAFVGRCKIVQFQHNDMNDLELKLQNVATRSPTMVMADGVYSMEGDIANLPAIKGLCDTHTVPLAVDDAHGLGTLGATGRGIEEHFNMPGAADILTGTFSKSLASIGGWVAGEAKIIDWIRFYGRSMIFSAAIAPPSLAAAETALEILCREPWRVKKLNENADYWRTGLNQLGFDTGQSKTAIVPVIIGDDLKCAQLGQALLEAGVYVNVAAYPAVPRHLALLRTSVMATHSRSQLDQGLAIFDRVGKKLGVIENTA